MKTVGKLDMALIVCSVIGFVLGPVYSVIAHTAYISAYAYMWLLCKYTLITILGMSVMAIPMLLEKYDRHSGIAWGLSMVAAAFTVLIATYYFFIEYTGYVPFVEACKIAAVSVAIAYFAPVILLLRRASRRLGIENKKARSDYAKHIRQTVRSQ